MSSRKRHIIIVCFSVLLIYAVSGAAVGKDPRWKEWDKKIFEQAKNENKFVILDLEAVWCHWCHVMAKVTYQNSGVTKLLDQHFIAVRVDQDNRPDLANRYRDYGWPATIIFTPDGREVVKRSGYIPPNKMIGLLRKLVKLKSSFGVKSRQDVKIFSSSPLLGSQLRETLVSNHQKSFDSLKGSLKIEQKFIDRDSVEYSLLKSRAGNKSEAIRANKTLMAALALIDPVWGGAYQYSTHRDWDHPHYEKIMKIQTGYMKIYAKAWQQYKRPEYLRAALAIHGYLTRFLMSAEGVFYTSQDADLVQGEHSDEYFKLGDRDRLKLGVPRVDKNRYARENGWVIEALIVMHQATGHKKYLQQAIRTAHWVLKNRVLAAGGFKHGKSTKFGPYLGDTLAMARAMLALYTVTQDIAWLYQADSAGLFMAYNFRNKKAGFNSAGVKGQVIKPVPHIDENISVTRFYIQLYAVTRRKIHKEMAEQGLRYLVTPAIATERITEVGIILAADEYQQIAILVPHGS